MTDRLELTDARGVNVAVGHVQPGLLFDEASAVISLNDLHRYELHRRWALGPAALFVMLNPSTADHRTDDPTIRRCIGFAKREGFAAIAVVNLFSYRATDPSELVDAVGAGIDVNPEENSIIVTRYMAAPASEIGLRVAAWGAWFDSHQNFARIHPEKMTARTPLHSLGVSKSGQPRHPLYLKKDAELSVWPPKP
jgi:hypothetical protein